MIQIDVITDNSNQYVEEAVKLHIEALSYRSFITDLGFDFMFNFYKTMLELNLGFLVVATDDNGFLGFILATEKSTSLFKSILKKFNVFIPILLKNILKNPTIIGKILETLFYSKNENSNIDAELVVIAVNKNKRSKGVGKLLIDKLTEVFRKKRISDYKVTVHKEMDKSNNFYLKNGFELTNTFKMYRVEWNLYTKNLKHLN